ncbi:MAG: type II toxin-antitoxin system VapC family toxin [Microlunatus sp.]
MLVVDSSAVLSDFLPDEDGLDLADFIDSETDVVAPWLLWTEVRNIVVTAERRGRMSRAAADDVVDAVDSLDVSVDTGPRSGAVLHLARKHDLSVYDALYLELALRRRADLLTLDRALRRARQS